MIAGRGDFDFALSLLITVCVTPRNTGIPRIPAKVPLRCNLVLPVRVSGMNQNLHQANYVESKQRLRDKIARIKNLGTPLSSWSVRQTPKELTRRASNKQSWKLQTPIGRFRNANNASLCFRSMRAIVSSRLREWMLIANSMSFKKLDPIGLH